ncbi:LacI family DNA-binding transcriptional regulator [Rhizobium herbae]
MNLTEFAKKLGLSVSTVSRALNGYTDVSDATRRKIFEAAEQLGYVANPAARGLRKRSSGLIAFVLSYPQKQFASPFFLDMLVGIDERLRETEFQLVVTTSPSMEGELACFKRLVEKQRVDGLIFARTRKHDDRIEYLQSSGVPFVTHGRSETSEPFPYLDIDHGVVGRNGCGRFIGLGHTRIALLNTPSYLMYSHHRRAGYEAALKAAQLKVDKSLIVDEELTEEGGAAGARKLLCLKNPPTAILCGNDLVAMGAMRAISEAGLQPGSDVGVIGSDDNPYGKYLPVPLTTFHSPVVEVGRRLSDLLLLAIDGKPASELQELWIPELVIRASDGPSRRASDHRPKKAVAAS